MLTIKKSTNNSLIPVRIGSLLVSAGIVRADQLAMALAEARRSERRLGEVVVSSGLASQEDMHHAAELQAMIKAGKITVEMGTQALRQAREKQRNIHAALTDMGWKDDRAIKANDLATILVEARVVSQDQINQASWNAAKNMLPLGRNLVLAGAVSPSMLGSGLTALVLLRDGLIARDAAVAGLRKAHQTKISLEEALGINASQNHVRIGELLSAAGLVSESDAMIAVETGLLNQKSIGEVLLKSRMITPLVLDACVKLQKLIVEGRMGRLQAAELLRTVADKDMGLEDVLNEMTYVKSRVFELLMRSNLVTQLDLQRALAINPEHENDMVRALMSHGVVSQDLFRACVRCVYAVENGQTNVDGAVDYLRRTFNQTSSGPMYIVSA
jgi:hypothetical protein